MTNLSPGLALASLSCSGAVASLLAAVAGTAGAATRGLWFGSWHGRSESSEECDEQEELVGELHCERLRGRSRLGWVSMTVLFFFFFFFWRGA